MKKAIDRGPVADFIDTRFQTNEIMRIAYIGRELKDVSSFRLTGFHVRALKGGGIGTISISSPERLQQAIADAIEGAVTVGRFNDPPIRFAPAPVIKDTVRIHPSIDPRHVSFEEKNKLLQEYNNLVLATEKIASTEASYCENFCTTTYVNSEGTEIEQELLCCYIIIRITSKDGNRVHEMSVVIGHTDDFAILLNRHSEFQKGAKVAVELLSAEPVKAGKYTVILDHDLGGIFVHEAFGHLSESDTLIHNAPLRQMMTIGRRLGSDILNIVDQGNLPHAPGTYAYDDEGVSSRKTWLVKNGVLVGRLHSRASAAAFEENITGNCRAVDFRFTPIVRQSNIFIESGQSSFEEMVDSIEDGLYLIGPKGGQTIGDQFTFGALYGYEIKHGKLGKMVCDINLSGNLFTTLKNITAIAGDRRIGERGGCGKGSAGPMQMMDKSGYTSPHIKIESVIIGGR